MDKKYFLKFFGFVAITFIYLAFYDPSTKHFITDLTALFQKGFQLHNALKLISWVLGLWCIVLLIGGGSGYGYVLSLALLIGTAFINLAYTSALHTEISLHNIGKCIFVFENLASISATNLIKFCKISTVYVILTIVMENPIIKVDKYIVMFVVAVFAVSVLLVESHNLNWQLFYLVPGFFIYHYLHAATSWVLSKISK